MLSGKMIIETLGGRKTVDNTVRAVAWVFFDPKEKKRIVS